MSVCRLQQLALGVHVNAVESRMTGIDRQRSCVLLDDGSVLPYVAYFGVVCMSVCLSVGGDSFWLQRIISFVSVCLLQVQSFGVSGRCKPLR